MEIQVNKAKKMMDMVQEPVQIKPVIDVPKKKAPKSGKIIVIILALLLVIAVGAGAFIYMRYRDLQSDPKSAITEKNQAETDRVLTSLKQTLLIGETDAPTVARVEDPEKLKSSNQEFYKDIVKGDYLIIFPKRAIIYRESNDQIINIAPIINTADLKAKEGTTPAATEEAKN